jgi:molybdate transport system permease protein
VLDLSPDEWTAVALSLRIAVVATVVSLPFGIAVAWFLARKDFWGKALLDGVVHLPLVLPPVVTGYLLLITFGRKGAVGAFLADHFGIVFSFRWTGAALACGVMAFPLLVRAIRLSFEAIDRRLEDAAATLGANGIWTFVTVSLPPAWCWRLPRLSANSAPPSPSSPTSRARRRRCRRRSTRSRRFPMAMPPRCASSSSPS